MCTVILAFQAFEGCPLKVAANRDEQLDRPAETFQLRPTEPATFSPRDLRAGGTWIGVNETGLVAAITNRFSSTVDDPQQSRGILVNRALRASGPESAIAAILDLDPTHFSGFHLTVANVESAITVWSDTTRFTRIDREPGIHVVTERSFGAAPSPREDWLNNEIESIESADEIDDLLLHQSEDGFNGTLVTVEQMNYGTRSSTIIELGEQPELRHAHGRPDQVAYRDFSATFREFLAGGDSSRSNP